MQQTSTVLLKRGFIPWGRLALMLALAGLGARVQATDLTVQVQVKGSGQALADAAVCLGTAANPSQFGAYRTAMEGRVRFENVPRHGHLLTVSKPGYLGISRPVDTFGTEQVLIIGLARGGGGPTCDAAPPADAAEAPTAAGLLVERLRLNGGARTTRDRHLRLTVQLHGEANQYRVSETADFRDADWQSFGDTLEYTLSEGRGLKRVYFQVRRYRSVGQSSLETLSPVTSATIRLE